MWQNFSMWRGRLPHWRADGVYYYLTFRHRRELSDEERETLLRGLQASHGKRWRVLIACVLPEQTELIVSLLYGGDGLPFELSDVVEKAKTKAGRAIIARSGERFPPFYNESYDRILRDESEMESFSASIFSSPVTNELVEESETYPFLWLPERGE